VVARSLDREGENAAMALSEEELAGS
jgi:hypothetical protein